MSATSPPGPPRPPRPPGPPGPPRPAVPAGPARGGAGAKEQLGRLLSLVPFLYSRAGAVRLDEAAQSLGVSPAQLVRDLKVLLMCGLPGGYPDDLIDVDLDALDGPAGERTIRVSNADYLARPLRLSATEATAMIVALRALRAGAGPETREVVDRALAKLEAAAADGADLAAVRRLAPGQPGPELATAGTLARLAEELRGAVDTGRQVHLRYHTPSRDEVSERDVDPRGVVSHAGVDYLDAWCHLAEAPRLFRLDRIDRAEVLDRAVTSEPEQPRDLADGLFAHARDAATAVLELDPPAQWMVEYYPVDLLTRGDDGTWRVELTVVDQRWLTRLLMRLAPHARLVGPPEAIRDFTATAQQARALHSWVPGVE